MNISSVLLEAGTLMLVGMVVVFLFLTMLIGAINLLTKFAEAFPDKETTSAPAKITPQATNSNQTSPQVIAAISAAVKQYKSRNK
jgi:oxaloacetate decarboxylase gamma subunit